RLGFSISPQPALKSPSKIAPKLVSAIPWIRWLPSTATVASTWEKDTRGGTTRCPWVMESRLRSKFTFLREMFRQLTQKLGFGDRKDGSTSTAEYQKIRF